MATMPQSGGNSYGFPSALGSLCFRRAFLRLSVVASTGGAPLFRLGRDEYEWVRTEGCARSPRPSSLAAAAAVAAAEDGAGLGSVGAGAGRVLVGLTRVGRRGGPRRPAARRGAACGLYR